MIPVCRCSKCQSLYQDDNPQNAYALRYRKLPKGIKKIYDSTCPLCLTDEFIEECLCEELITAPNVKEAKQIAEKTFPDYLYLMSTSRGTSTQWRFKNFIFIK